MRRVVIDTSLYSRALSGQEDAADILRDAEELLLCPIVIGELLSGFDRSAHPQRNRNILRKFTATPRVVLTPISAETAEFYSAVLTRLRAQGTPIPTNDLWIAATALEHGAHLATADTHFQHVAGLLTVFV